MDETDEVVDSSEDESSDSDCEVWKIYSGKEPLDAFLEENRPSQLSICDAAWIAVDFEQDYEDEDDEEQDDEIHEGKQQPDEADRQTDEEREDKLRVSLLSVQEEQGNNGEDRRETVEQTKQQEHKPKDTNTNKSGKRKEQEGEVNEDTKELPRCVLYEMIREEWKYLLENKHVKMVTRETLKGLALKYGYTSGKWMIFARSEYIDDLWFTIAKAVVAGKLGFSTKVSTKNPEEKSHVICVYTEDFTDEDDIKRMEKALRDVGIYEKMSYKADIYTILGIYKNNDLGITPSIFKSEDVRDARASGIKDNERNTNGQRVQRVYCLSYDGKESLDLFSKRNKPSQVKGRDASWISVSYQHHVHHHPCREDMLLIEAEWKELQKKREIKSFGAEFLKDLAVKYGYTSGKWMIFTNSYEVDDIWFSVAKAVNAGRLGYEAKVSTKKSNEDHVIYVYTKDFTDESDVRRVERSLRNSGIRRGMSYKPDIYTSLGISAKNDLGISPTVFYSKTFNYRSRYRY